MGAHLHGAPKPTSKTDGFNKPVRRPGDMAPTLSVDRQATLSRLLRDAVSAPINTKGIMRRGASVWNADDI